MAYDPHSAYEAPRRAYYGQAQQQPPQQQRSNGGQYHQYNDSHGQYNASREYDNGHNSPHGQPMSHDPYGQSNYDNQQGYDQREYGPRYDSGYGGDFGKPPPRGASAQQRPHPGARAGPPRQNYGEQYDYDNTGRQARRPPQRPYESHSEVKHPPQHGAWEGSGSESRAGRRHPSPPKGTPGSFAQGQQHPPRGASRAGDGGAPAMTMEQWKAKERGRMNPRGLDTIAQDNAFPTFSNSSRPASNATMNSSSENNIAARPTGHGQRAPHSYDQTTSSQMRQGEIPVRQAIPERRPQTHQASQYAQDYATEVENPYDYSVSGADYDSRPEVLRQNSATRQLPLRPLDTSITTQPPRPPYLDHQPMSPGVVPPRPSTATDSRMNQPRSPYEAKSYVQQSQMADSLDDLYNTYANDDFTPQPLKRAMTRDEEIESEMPNFDSAQRRSRQDDIHTTPKPPNGFVNGSQPAHSTTRDDDRYAARGVPVSGYAGFDFGVPQDHDLNSGSNAMAPPHAPFATEPPVRRSMDDARQMPYQPGPPRGPLPTRPTGQRSQPNGPAPRGAIPPHIRPPMDRSQSARPLEPADQYGGHQPRAGSAPPPRQMNGIPMQQGQRGPPEPSNQQRTNNPDALPAHPVPIRPGLMANDTSHPAKPAPVRNYDRNAGAQPPSRTQSVDDTPRPVTQAELAQIRAAADANPNSPRQALVLVKKLAEAVFVLADEGGRADPKTTAKNRERYSSEAYKRLKKLVAAGYPDAMFYMADCLGSGELGLEPDAKEAFTLYQAAAKGGHAQAAFRTAVCCEMGPEDGGGTRKDFAKAVQWYRRAAALGDVAAMYKTGAILLKGLLGQEKHLGEAINWLKRSADKADKANPHALHELGLLYDPANTAPEVRNKIIADENYARELFENAAKLGFKPSQFRLGQMYEYEQLGLPIDNRASIAWYSKAAAQGEHQAELALSGWYLTGAEGILQQSDTEAYLWARKAASSEAPLSKALFAMGYFSEQGIGCPPSLDEARKWYGRAAAYKFPKALERLEELKNVKSGKGRPLPGNAKLSRKDQKRDEAECVVM